VDIAELCRLYQEEGLTTPKLAERFGVPERTMSRYLAKAGLRLHRPGDIKLKELADREWLEQRYLLEGKSTPQIAAELDCEPKSVSWWLARHGIPARSTGSTPGHTRNDSDETRAKHSASRKGKYTGTAHWNYKGGRVRNPERWDWRSMKWARAVKARDGMRCVECGATDRLHAHHIVRWIHSVELRYELSNGVTLCYSCHEKAHGPEFGSRRFKKAKRSTSAPHPSS
jgi:5-methylcytosine-specific restriction endonuclease McrA